MSTFCAIAVPAASARRGTIGSKLESFMARMYQIPELLQHGQQRARRHEETAFGYAFRGRTLQCTVQFLRRRPAGEKVREGPADADHLIRRLMHKFEPEMTDSRREPFGQMKARLLRFGAKDGVTAAHVGHHRMRPAIGIAQCDLVLLARPSAIAITGAGGKESAEHAVFGVEHGQMMV